MSEHVLVIGGAGFVGSNLVRALIAEDASAEVVVVDNLLSAEAENVPSSPRVRLVAESVTRPGLLDELGAFDTVFELATFHGNQNSMADPLADHENNLRPTVVTFDHYARTDPSTRVVYSSAGCTVAPKTWNEPVPTNEDAPVSLWLDTPYQISKVVGEFYANYYTARHGLPVMKARFQNVYGPGEILGAGVWRGTPATVWRNVTPTFVYRALHGMDLIIDNPDASRDFIYVDDIVRGLISCARNGESGGVYNLASGRETKIVELADLIVGLSGSSSRIVMGPGREWDRSGRRYGAPEHAAEAIGFTAMTPIEEGLRRTIEWTRANMDLIDRCIARHRDAMAVAGAG